MFMGREGAVIVSSVWKGVGIGAVNRKHISCHFTYIATGDKNMHRVMLS